MGLAGMLRWMANGHVGNIIGGGEQNAQTQFFQCVKCKKTLFQQEFEDALFVCVNCGHHHRVDAHNRIRITFDQGSFKELDGDLKSSDPLDFPEYGEKYKTAVAKTGLNDSVVCGSATLEGMPVQTAVAEFAFMGGSMGVVAGEKIARTLERAADLKQPAIIFTASGGARMQEGLLSLMQMAKTVGVVEQCRRAGVPFISIFTDPTMAGVLASYASVADVIIAEPKALVGFAGSRVSAQAQVIKPPEDFQTAEFVLRSGMVDMVIDRREIKQTLAMLIRSLGATARGEDGKRVAQRGGKQDGQ